MKRLRIFARIHALFNPCLWATDIDPIADALWLAALHQVVQRIPQLTFTLEDRPKPRS